MTNKCILSLFFILSFKKYILKVELKFKDHLHFL
jgi:hypothetical protein